MCEALVIVLRFVDEKWNMKQHVVQLMLLAKSMSGEKLARQLIVCLSTELAISSDNLLTCMRDRASVNSVAVRMLKIVFPNSLTSVVSVTQLTTCWRTLQYSSSQ